MSLIQLSKKPFSQLIKYSAPNNNLAVLSSTTQYWTTRSQSTNSSVQKSAPKGNEGVEEKPSPFQVSPFRGPFSNKLEYAVARVDDLLNAVRRVSSFAFWIPLIF
jgi:hypothetical protein